MYIYFFDSFSNLPTLKKEKRIEGLLEQTISNISLTQRLNIRGGEKSIVYKYKRAHLDKNNVMNNKYDFNFLLPLPAIIAQHHRGEKKERKKEERITRFPIQQPDPSSSNKIPRIGRLPEDVTRSFNHCHGLSRHRSYPTIIINPLVYTSIDCFE